MEIDKKKKNRVNWLMILFAIAAIIFAYSAFVMFKIGDARSVRQNATDFWFRDVGIGGFEAGLSADVCNNRCSEICFGDRPALDPLSLSVLLPVSRARVCCHDTCNKAICNQPRPTDTICGHRIDGWALFSPLAGVTTCLFDAF